MYLNYYNPVNLRVFMNQFNLRLICYFGLNVTGMYIFLFAPPPGGSKNISFYLVWKGKIKKEGKREEKRAPKRSNIQIKYKNFVCKVGSSSKFARALETCKITRFLSCGFGEKI